MASALRLMLAESLATFGSDSSCARSPLHAAGGTRGRRCERTAQSFPAPRKIRPAPSAQSKSFFDSTWSNDKWNAKLVSKRKGLVILSDSKRAERGEEEPKNPGNASRTMLTQGILPIHRHLPPASSLRGKMRLARTLPCCPERSANRAESCGLWSNNHLPPRFVIPSEARVVPGAMQLASRGTIPSSIVIPSEARVE